MTEDARFAFHGPLTMKWYGETWLASEDGEPMWKSIPELEAQQRTFGAAMEHGAANREAIVAAWESTGNLFKNLVGFAMARKNELPDEIKPMLEGLNNQELQIIGRQVAATGLRLEFLTFTPEEQVVLMGVAEGAGLPYDAIVLLQALMKQDLLPPEVAPLIKLMKATGYDSLGNV